MATQLTSKQRAAGLCEKLLIDRGRGDRWWRTHSTAARIEALQEAGMPWARVLNQDDEVVAAARPILENEESDS